MLGFHWIAQGHGCPGVQLDEEHLRTALLRTPEAIGATRVSEPLTYRHGDASLTGVVLIAESHIALHAFPLSGELHVDIFSCKSFSVETARQLLAELFGVQRWSEQQLQAAGND